MSVFLSFLKISPASLELLKRYPEAQKILARWDNIQNPDHWEPTVKVMVGKKGLANLEPVRDRIPQLIRELNGQSAESFQGGIWLEIEELETVVTPEEMEYMVAIGTHGRTDEPIGCEVTYWTAEDVARIAEIISRIENPYDETYGEAYEDDEVDPFTYIIDAAQNGTAMLLRVF